MDERQIAGRYKHYKGKQYEVLGVGLHTETEERMIVYQGLYEPYQIWVRPYDMFFDTVVVEGIETLRFKRLD